MSKPILTLSAVDSYFNNKIGNLKPDANGYYDVNLGALNVFNSYGAFYMEEGSKELFKPGGLIDYRLKNGYLNGEVGHPKKLPGMTDKDYANRLASIFEENISHHIKSIRLLPTNDSQKAGTNVILIRGLVKPEGPKSEFLKEKFSNPDSNVAFSVRALNKNIIVDGVLHKQMMNIITWDFVNEPGIEQASKWQTLGTEMNIEERELIKVDFNDFKNTKELEECLNCTLESNNSIFNSIRSDIINEFKSFSKGADILYKW